MRGGQRVVQSLLFKGSTKFAATYRLLRKDGFSHVVRCESVADKQFKVFFSHNGKCNARLGIIVSKKILPGAVDRNLVKRIVRAVFRQHNIKACKLDMVVIVRNASPFEVRTRSDILRTLFNRVVNRCAEL